MCKNSDLEKFVSKCYAQSKTDGKYHKNRHFKIWFLENSKKIQKILQKYPFLILKDASFQPFSTLVKEDCVFYTCAKVVHFEHIWKVENLLFS